MPPKSRNRAPILGALLAVALLACPPGAAAGALAGDDSSTPPDRATR